mgnify:CR=1 FL=1
MALIPKERQHLKALAHKLKPVILVGGNGVTPAVMKEVEQAIYHHELIKIKIQTTDREERREMFEKIRDESKAELVQVIGGIGVFYRKRID